MSRVSLITGGAGGIGRATAERLIARGDDVIIADRHPRTAEVADELGCSHLITDIADPAQVSDMFEQVRDGFGHLDWLVLNAGVAAGWGPLDQVSPDEYRTVMRVNVDGVFLAFQSTAAVMASADNPAVVVTASMAGLTGSPDPTYAAAKAAVVAMVRSVAPQLAKKGITVNAVCPSFVDTPLVHQGVRESGYPLLTPGKVADALVTAGDSGETGQAWIVQVGHEPSPYRFRGVPGARAEDGTAVPLRVAE